MEFIVFYFSKKIKEKKNLCINFPVGGQVLHDDLYYQLEFSSVLWRVLGDRKAAKKKDHSGRLFSSEVYPDLS